MEKLWLCIGLIYALTVVFDLWQSYKINIRFVNLFPSEIKLGMPPTAIISSFIPLYNVWFLLGNQAILDASDEELRNFREEIGDDE